MAGLAAVALSGAVPPASPVPRYLVLSLLIVVLGGGIVLAERGLTKLRARRARSWSATLPFRVSGFGELAGERWKDVRATVAFATPPTAETEALVTELAHLLEEATRP